MNIKLLLSDYQKINCFICITDKQVILKCNIPYILYILHDKQILCTFNLITLIVMTYKILIYINIR